MYTVNVKYLYAIRSGMTKLIRVNDEDLERFEKWLDARFSDGVETGSLRKDDKQSMRFKYMVNRCIDAESKLKEKDRKLEEEQRIHDSASRIIAELNEKCDRLQARIEQVRAYAKNLEDEKDKGFW